MNTDIPVGSRNAITSSHNGQVVAAGQTTAPANALLLGLPGVGLLRSEGNTDAYEMPCIVGGHPAALLSRLPCLDTGQARFDSL